MLNEWPQHDRLDARRAGAFGFSNGGLTVLVAAGGVPDLAKMAAYSSAHPEHDLCQALRQAGVDPKIGSNVAPDVWIHDPRIQAAVIAGPAFGFAFNRAGLKDVHIPIQLWRAANDGMTGRCETLLPKAPEYHVVLKAGDYDFFAAVPAAVTCDEASNLRGSARFQSRGISPVGSGRIFPQMSGISARHSDLQRLGPYRYHSTLAAGRSLLELGNGYCPAKQRPDGVVSGNPVISLPTKSLLTNGYYLLTWLPRSRQ